MKNILIMSSLIIAVSSCGIYGPPPGQGKIAEAYYEKSIPIISALEDYYKQYGSYPNSLDELIPKHLSSHEWPSQWYESTGDNYKLWFSYEGPGINSCVYEPGKDWECSGLL